MTKPPRLVFEATSRQRLLGSSSRSETAGVVAILLVALATLGWIVWQGHVLGLERQRLQAALERERAAMARPAPRPADMSTPTEALRQMDAVTARLNVPWSDVLDAIERRATPRVAMLALEPDARIGLVALTIEARSLDDLLRYAEALGHDNAIASVRLGQHDSRAQEPGQPVRLTLSVSPVPLRR